MLSQVYFTGRCAGTLLKALFSIRYILASIVPGSSKLLLIQLTGCDK
jgi:hypothetical protein